MSNGNAKKEVCSTSVCEVVIPTHNYLVVNSRYKEGFQDRDFVRFIVHEEERKKDQRKRDDRKLFINDHRETTFRAARSQISKQKRGMRNTTGNVMTLAEAVRLPARVVVVEMTTETGKLQFVNLFPLLGGGKTVGLFMVLSQILIEECLFLDGIVKYEPLWWWGGRKNTLFGPSGDSLPVVALTNEDRKIIFRCRKSGDIVTLGDEIEKVELGIYDI